MYKWCTGGCRGDNLDHLGRIHLGTCMSMEWDHGRSWWRMRRTRLLLPSTGCKAGCRGSRWSPPQRTRPWGRYRRFQRGSSSDYRRRKRSLFLSTACKGGCRGSRWSPPQRTLLLDRYRHYLRGCSSGYRRRKWSLCPSTGCKGAYKASR